MCAQAKSGRRQSAGELERRPERWGAGQQNGRVAVGERVKVTYTKATDGNKVTTVQPANGGM